MNPLNNLVKMLIVGLFATILSLLSTSELNAQIFVTNVGTDSIGEYSLTGQTINSHFASGGGFPTGLAISGNDLYVSDIYSDNVSEFNATTGASINPNLITNVGGESPYSLAISGNTLYITAGNSIEKYTTSGAPVNTSFVTGLAGTGDIALSGNDLFVVNNAGYTYATIEEFDATTGQVINSSLISNLYDTFGLTASGGYLYTTSYAGGSVSKFTLSGQVVNANLVSGLGDAGAVDVAVSGNDLYVTDANTDTVREYDATTGAPINTDLISVTYFPHGILVVVPEPSTWVMLLGGLGLLAFWHSRAFRA